MQLKLLNDLGPRMKMFSWKCNHHVDSEGYTPSLTLSRLFPLKKILLKESIDYYDHFRK